VCRARFDALAYKPANDFFFHFFFFSLQQMMVLPRDKDGRQRHVRDLDQKLVAFRPEGIHPGNLVGVVSGEHEGMYARIVQLLAGDKVRIRFERR
jgi:hypothetical protein